MRIIFCGTPEFSVPSLRRLLSDPRFTVEAVITQPDRPRGRGGTVTPSPVKEVALAAGLRVFQPERIKADIAYEFISSAAPDAVIIIAYGQIVPSRLIQIPRLGWLNLHASLLPQYRGAAPIAWAIMNGETKTGLTTMQIDPGMDTGPILLQQELAIGPDETAPELTRRLSDAGAPLVIDSLIQLNSSEIAPQPQDSSLATYAPILEKEHGRLDWSWAASRIYNRVRGLQPWPGAFTTFRNQLCHVWVRPAEGAIAARSLAPGTLFAGAGTVYVVCGDGTCVALEAVRMEGRKRIAAQEFANGTRLMATDRFGT